MAPSTVADNRNCVAPSIRPSRIPSDYSGGSGVAPPLSSDSVTAGAVNAVDRELVDLPGIIFLPCGAGHVQQSFV